MEISVKAVFSNGEKCVGGSTVKQKAAINSLFQAEGDATNPLCECFKLLL